MDPDLQVGDLLNALVKQTIFLSKYTRLTFSF